MPFLKDDFLLTTDTARKLYFGAAADMPIIDYHCHVSPREIYEDKRFSALGLSGVRTNARSPI